MHRVHTSILKSKNHEWVGSGFLKIEIGIKDSLNSIHFKNLKEQQQQLVFMKEPVVFWAVI
jgi:hypothetical protein